MPEPYHYSFPWVAPKTPYDVLFPIKKVESHVAKFYLKFAVKM